MVYGIGLGDAKFTGQFGPGISTDYLKTAPGTYPVEGLASNGSWGPLASDTFTVDVRHAYSITLAGTWDTGVHCDLTVDR